jgi:hypothetical protein
LLTRHGLQQVREKTILKASGKVRALGIPTTRDRVVQAALKMVLEPIFEAEFKPCSYGFRPRRRAQDAIAEIHYLASPSRNYEWVFEADIKACFDEIDHTALMGRVRRRVRDKRVLGWVKAFLRAGILSPGLSWAFVTNTSTGQLAFLEARHRAHARVEDRIRHAKDTGLGRFPSREFKINQTWLMLTQIAADLTAWARLLAFTGDAAVLATCEPKALRYRFLHVPARLVHSGRRRRLRIPETWPWVTAIVAVFANIAAIPQPA